jgi:hypothetical protein
MKNANHAKSLPRAATLFRFMFRNWPSLSERPLQCAPRSGLSGPIMGRHLSWYGAKRALQLVSSILVTVVASYAQNTNVALNKPVALNGNFPVFSYPGDLCGANPPQPSPSSVDNGVFLPEGTCFQSGIYWSSVAPNANPNNTVDIDLGGVFLISSATVQADDNDSYTLQYRDVGGVYHDWWDLPLAGTFGLVTRPNATDPTQQQPLTPVIATGLRFFAPAVSGDGYYAVSQIAVFGVAIPLLTSYAANLNSGESYIDIANTGANGASLLGPGFGAAAGNLCVNVYAFDPGEELIACCSCLITPGETVNLGVNRDLTVKTLTGVVPASVTVKLLATLAGTGGSGSSCTNTAATLTTATLATGSAAWSTTLHSTPSGAFATTEIPFTQATLSAGELASVSGRCASILGNGSGFGVCNSCRAGALGAGKQ